VLVKVNCFDNSQQGRLRGKTVQLKTKEMIFSLWSKIFCSLSRMA